MGKWWRLPQEKNSSLPCDELDPATISFFVTLWTPTNYRCHWCHDMQSFPFSLVSCLFLCKKLHLFLEKSTKTVATRAALFVSNMHHIVCRLGLSPTPHWGAYSAPPDPFAVFRNLLLRGRGGEEREGEVRGGEGRGGREFVLCPGKKKKSRRLWTALLISVLVELHGCSRRQKSIEQPDMLTIPVHLCTIVRMQQVRTWCY